MDSSANSVLGRQERRVVRIVRGGHSEPVRLLADLLDQVVVRGEVNGLADALVQGALRAQQADSRLAPAGVLLDHHIAVVAPVVEPLVQHLAVLAPQIWPRPAGQPRVDVPGPQQRLAVPRTDPVPNPAPQRRPPSPDQAASGRPYSLVLMPRRGPGRALPPDAW